MAGSVLNQIVDNVYVLNLSRDSFKYDILAKKLGELEIEHERFIGTDGKSPEFTGGLNGTGFGKVYRSSGAIGCLVSHINILEDAVEKKYNKILLLQDDIYFHQNFEALLGGFLPMIESSDGFYLGASEWSKTQRDRCKDGLWEEGSVQGTYGKSLVYETTPKTYGLFGLILGSRTFEDILKLMKCYFNAADQAVAAVLGSGFSRTSLVAYPNLIIPDTGESNTWSDNTLGKFNKLIHESGEQNEKRPLEDHSKMMGWDTTKYDLTNRYYNT
jgi:hypothetical protein